ncbi:hypothetical protein EV426DRAFT_120233 [Tirmania nivea]|nr:hypothetical protein EV426DRAFT_120233 [Tirmania nivea]
MMITPSGVASSSITTSSTISCFKDIDSVFIIRTSSSFPYTRSGPWPHHGINVSDAVELTRALAQSSPKTAVLLKETPGQCCPTLAWEIFPSLKSQCLSFLFLCRIYIIQSHTKYTNRLEKSKPVGWSSGVPMELYIEQYVRTIYLSLGVDPDEVDTGNPLCRNLWGLRFVARHCPILLNVDLQVVTRSRGCS